MLNLNEAKTEKVTIPKGLKKEGKKFWLGVLRDYMLEEAHHLKLLYEAGRCLDTIALAEKQIKKDGHYYIDRWSQPHSHPGLKEVKDNQIIFSKLVRELGLDICKTDRSTRQY